MIKPFNKSQLQGIRDGLHRDLSAVLAANASSKKKLDRLSSPEYLNKYRPDALAAMRQEAIEEESKTVLDIIKTISGTKEMIEQQNDFWEKDFWRDALLYSGPPEVKITNDAILTSAEKSVQTLANFVSSTSYQLMETSGRMWLIKELELMTAEQFIKTVQDASENGKAGILYISRLVYENRSFHSEEERGRVGAVLFTAERAIKLPIRMDALEMLEACSELVEDIQSAWLALSKGEEDFRSKVRPYAEERKKREDAEKSARQVEKQKLEVVEDNLILTGHA